uniref:Uncharacterized protein n=1 Tax=Triticum urartu TaxID=4572 RepID=A0A8R7UU12_TRIUA
MVIHGDGGPLLGAVARRESVLVRKETRREERKREEWGKRFPLLHGLGRHGCLCGAHNACRRAGMQAPHKGAYQFCIMM